MFLESWESLDSIDPNYKLTNSLNRFSDTVDLPIIGITVDSFKLGKFRGHGCPYLIFLFNSAMHFIDIYQSYWWIPMMSMNYRKWKYVKLIRQKVELFYRKQQTKVAEERNMQASLHAISDWWKWRHRNFHHLDLQKWIYCCRLAGQELLLWLVTKISPCVPRTFPECGLANLLVPRTTNVQSWSNNFKTWHHPTAKGCTSWNLKLKDLKLEKVME